MMNYSTTAVWVLSGLLMLTSAFAAPDYAREKRWADEVVPGVIVGEPMYLTQANQHSFLGLLTEADHARMALVIVHGAGIHPDWGMVGTLRQQLFDAGYTTLSIQMPVLAADASYAEYPAVFPDAVERLQLSVAYLKKRGYRRIAIVSHSNGSRMSRVYMAQNPPEVIAWAALSLTQGDTFADIRVPILDLYAEHDLPHVLNSVTLRKRSLLNHASKQWRINNTDHFFADHEGEMVNAVKDFLQGLNLSARVSVSNLTGADPAPFCSTWD